MSKLPKIDLDCYLSGTGRAESTRVNPFTRPLNPAPGCQVPARPESETHNMRGRVAAVRHPLRGNKEERRTKCDRRGTEEG